MKRNINDIVEIPLNHNSGVKKVLFNWQDVDTPCRQISIANFKKGDVCEPHTHETLDEHFYWQKGSGYFVINDEKVSFSDGDYIYVKSKCRHSIHFEEDSQCVCIGIALDWKNEGNKENKENE